MKRRAAIGLVVLADMPVPLKVKLAVIQHVETSPSLHKRPAKSLRRPQCGAWYSTSVFRGRTDAQAPRLISEAHETLEGEVIVAHDLDSL
jgi:hypothetical protein